VRPRREPGSIQDMKKVLVAILALLTVQVYAQSYELDWKDRAVRVQQQAPNSLTVESPVRKTTQKQEVGPEPPKRRSESACQKNCSNWREAPLAVRKRVWPNRTEENEYPEPVDVEITVDQNYDHYNERYRLISRVESWIYRGSYPQNTVHCNRADYQSFTVYLNDLEKGDRFEVAITWDELLGFPIQVEKITGRDFNLNRAVFHLKLSIIEQRF